MSSSWLAASPLPGKASQWSKATKKGSTCFIAGPSVASPYYCFSYQCLRALWLPSSGAAASLRWHLTALWAQPPAQHPAPLLPFASTAALQRELFAPAFSTSAPASPCPLTPETSPAGCISACTLRLHPPLLHFFPVAW